MRELESEIQLIRMISIGCFGLTSHRGAVALAVNIGKCKLSDGRHSQLFEEWNEFVDANKAEDWYKVEKLAGVLDRLCTAVIDKEYANG